MKIKNPDLRLVQDFLKLHPKNKIELARHIGYKTSTTIDKWFEAKRGLPRLQREKVIHFIETRFAKEKLWKPKITLKMK